MKRTPQPLPLDYRLRISPFFDERNQKYMTRFTLETTQSFASFVYDLSVQERMEGNTIRWKIQGLKPPHLSMPSSGHARFERAYDALKGTYDITVESIDGRNNTFRIQAAKNSLKVLTSPREKFVDLVLESDRTQP
jgi:hypothetical protein